MISREEKSLLRQLEVEEEVVEHWGGFGHVTWVHG